MVSPNPLVTVVMPIYNSMEFLDEALTSVISQTYSNWELIAVIDKSTDGSKEHLEKYIKQDERINLQKTSGSCGAAAARNIGITRAKGKYIAFLDSDDVWLKEKLKNQIEFMEKNDVYFSFHDYEIINRFSNKKKDFISPKYVTYETLLKDSNIGTLSIVYNCDYLGKFMMPAIKARNDYGTWLEILKNVDRGHNVGKILAQYRETNNSLSSNKLKMIYFQFLLFYKFQNLGLLKSLHLVVIHIFIRLKKYIS